MRSSEGLCRVARGYGVATTLSMSQMGSGSSTVKLGNTWACLDRSSRRRTARTRSPIRIAPTSSGSRCCSRLLKHGVVGRTPGLAYERFRDAIAEALGCVTLQRLSVPRGRAFNIGQAYTIILNGDDPVGLRSNPQIQFSAGQTFRIVRIDNDEPRGAFEVQTTEYWYQFEIGGREILAFISGRLSFGIRRRSSRAVSIECMSH